MELKDVGYWNIEQPDGAVWSMFYDRELPDSRYLIVSSTGRGLMLGEEGIGYHGLKGLFSQYRELERQGNTNDFRDFLGCGQQANVYGMGSDFAVREVQGNPAVYSTLRELGNMDRLATVVEGGVPHWIRVPSFYACFSDTDTQKRYTLMQRIDSGLTVEDVLEYPDLPDYAKERVHKELKHEPTDEDKEEISRLYELAGTILDKVISSKGHRTEDYLVDWKPRNVIIEPLRTPIAGERFSMTVIDQN